MFNNNSYLSPKILLDGILTNKADIWSIGALTYRLLFGKTPFSDSYNESIEDSNYEFNFDSEEKVKISFYLILEFYTLFPSMSRLPQKNLKL